MALGLHGEDDEMIQAGAMPWVKAKELKIYKPKPYNGEHVDNILENFL